MSDSPADPEFRATLVPLPTVDIYGGDGSLWSVLCKQQQITRAGGAGSNAGALVGARAPLIDKVAARRVRDLNTTHATCCEAKRASSVGMGHRDQEIHDTLDPLCRYGWQDLLDSVGDDLIDTGEGFIEVVWDQQRTLVLGLNWLDSAAVSVVVESEQDTERVHYQVQSQTVDAETVAMASWGDMLGLRERYSKGRTRVDEAQRNAKGLTAALGGRIVDSEVIHLRMPNSRDPYQGYPDWIAATPAIELFQAMTRHEFDFHFNRGVPELLFTLIGGSISQKDWDEKIVPIFRAQQGIGQSRKTAALHFQGTPESVEVGIHKLALEGVRDEFGDKAQSLAMLIATAHGVPPILANILLPGKIGAANEAPNALLLFQKRKLGQVQRSVSGTLARTLGSDGTRLNQVDGEPAQLKAAQFLGSKFKSGMDENGAPIYQETGNGFKTVLDGMTLGAQQTLASMREPIAGSSRNPEDGLLEGADDRRPSDARRTR